MLAVQQEGSLVVLDLHGRRRDVLLSPLQAERLADGLEEAAALAEREPPSLFRGEAWGVAVTSFDKRVALRFTPPHVGAPERVPMPPGAARQVADLLRTNANMAGFGLRIETR